MIRISNSISSFSIVETLLENSDNASEISSRIDDETRGVKTILVVVDCWFGVLPVVIFSATKFILTNESFISSACPDIPEPFKMRTVN